MFELDIGGGKADRATDLVAVHDTPADAVGAAKEAGGVGHVTLGEGCAHGRAGDALVFVPEGVHGFDAKADFVAGGLEHGEVALAALAEAEVVADQEVAHTEAVDEHVFDEGFGGEPGEFLVEAADVEPVDALAFEQQDFFAKRCEASGAIFMGEVFPRVWLEGEHRGGKAGGLRLCPQLRQQRLVAAVHAIEVADGEHAAVFGSLWDSTENLHGADSGQKGGL